MGSPSFPTSVPVNVNLLPSGETSIFLIQYGWMGSAKYPSYTEVGGPEASIELDDIRISLDPSKVEAMTCCCIGKKKIDEANSTDIVDLGISCFDVFLGTTSPLVDKVATSDICSLDAAIDLEESKTFSTHSLLCPTLTLPNW
jgi:hypothetical protein